MRQSALGLKDANHRRTILFAAMAAGLLVLGSCSYYGQALYGGLEIVCRKRAIEALLADPKLDPGLRARLSAVTEMRRFAVAALGLPDNASYRAYADLGRPFASWTVTAAPALSLEPKTWCFPVAGCVTYRGYFSAARAEAFGAKLAAEGYDVDVGGVRAFSTLGWLADPVLNSFIHLPAPDLAGLLFHELAHQVIYVRDDTVFNESFATAVERAGVRRWLEAQGRGADVAAYDAAAEREGEVARLLQATRDELAAVYASSRSSAEKAAQKAEILAAARAGYQELTASWGMPERERAAALRWFDGLNNARLASWGAYAELVPAFEALLARDGGDLPRFYAEVRRLAALPKEQRRAALAGVPGLGLSAATPPTPGWF